jgi:hypothetical protein
MPTVRWPCTFEMAAHRGNAAALATDISLQQQHIDKHRHVLEAMNVLGKAHAVNPDHALCFDIDLRGAFDRLTGEA